MVPSLEDRVKLIYMMSHNRPAISEEEMLALNNHGGKVFVGENYYLWKTSILDKSIRGYQQPDRLAAVVILERTCTKGLERDYAKIQEIQSGDFTRAVERLYPQNLEGLGEEERTGTIMLDAVSLLAKYFVHLYYQREIREQAVPIRKRAGGPYN